MKELSADNPHRDACLDLVRNGIQLCTPLTYKGCEFEDKPSLSPAFVDTAAPVEKMMFTSYWEEGLSIILTEERVHTIDSLGLCLASWAKKLGKPCGRPIMNGTGRRGMPPERIINGKETKERAIVRYGGIDLPQIGDFAEMILEYALSLGIPREELRTFKYDVAAAFIKLSYSAAAVSHVGVELREGRYMFFLGGVFGLTSMPFALNVITNAVVWELNNRLLKGRVRQFVDDGLVVTTAWWLGRDMAATFKFLRGLLGPDAVAEAKTEVGLELDIIGYHSSLPNWNITIAEHNVLKAIYAFGMVDLTPGASITVKEVQKLASLGSRYGAICRALKPFVRILYATYAGRNQLGHVVFTPHARAIVRLFRNMFTLLGVGAVRFSRSFESFTTRRHTWVIEFDASLSGVGIIWFRSTRGGREEAMAHTSVDITCLGFGDDASFQNTAEYLGSLLGARGLEMMEIPEALVLLRGDSVSALTWAAKGSTRSTRAMPAAVLWAQYVITNRVEVVGTQHLSHDENSRTDILSRGGSWTEVLEEDQRNFGGSLSNYVPWLHLDCQELLQLADPQVDIDSEEAFDDFFQRCRDYLA